MGILIRSYAGVAGEPERLEITLVTGLNHARELLIADLNALDASFHDADETVINLKTLQRDGIMLRERVDELDDLMWDIKPEPEANA